MPDTERIELQDGWWEIRTVVTRAMRKAFRRAGLKGFAAGADGKEIDFSDPEALKRAILASPEKWDVDAIDDAYLLAGTVAYSYGEKVSLEIIDSLPETVVTPVLERMRKLYAEMPEEKRADFFGKR